ncbi:hypothetical protein FHX42_000616 [Saccharopolyspora lacisalsi]|uniref:Uncharacterized protein n=1 Tax=Halosaccharopolyspora lacisalsi TaxID=1000566 RepID=A0A839DV71_9PSEU|nr:DUF6346 domain-containing protein [Halosaccharopolyspora lacisalsi]MBA8823287.1 hypothetical protein [Halosaccharopolyspora lacisalsi]
MNLQSDDLAIRLGKMLAGFLVVVVLLLLNLTIVFSLQAGYSETNAIAHVRSCENKGPISWRGFGNNWNCTAVFQQDGTGGTWRATVDFNLFTPEEIGTPQRVLVSDGGGRIVSSENVEYHQSTGISPGAAGWIWTATTFVFIFPTLWVFSRSVVWSFSQEEQRKFWEKIYGTPEERAAKKEKDREFYRQIRQNRADRKEARRNGQRRQGKDPKKAARKRMRELERQRD